MSIWGGANQTPALDYRGRRQSRARPLAGRGFRAAGDAVSVLMGSKLPPLQKKRSTPVPENADYSPRRTSEELAVRAVQISGSRERIAIGPVIRCGDSWRVLAQACERRWSPEQNRYQSREDLKSQGMRHNYRHFLSL